MTDAQSLLIVLPSIVAILALLWAWFTYFPKVSASEFRIQDKKVGKFEYFRVQVKRPFFGWSVFYASTNDGTINRISGWDRERHDAEKQIKNYQDLRPWNSEGY